jgi:septal ring factor EnvC (AmiA/AmiB activator)
LQAEVTKWKSMLEVTVNQVKTQLMGGLSASVEKIETLKKSLEEQKELNQRLVARLTQLGVSVDDLSEGTSTDDHAKVEQAENEATVSAESADAVEMDSSSDEIVEAH